MTLKRYSQLQKEFNTNYIDARKWFDTLDEKTKTFLLSDELVFDKYLITSTENNRLFRKMLINDNIDYLYSTNIQHSGYDNYIEVHMMHNLCRTKAALALTTPDRDEQAIILAHNTPSCFGVSKKTMFMASVQRLNSLEKHLNKALVK